MPSASRRFVSRVVGWLSPEFALPYTILLVALGDFDEALCFHSRVRCQSPDCEAASWMRSPMGVLLRVPMDTRLFP